MIKLLFHFNIIMHDYFSIVYYPKYCTYIVSLNNILELCCKFRFNFRHYKHLWDSQQLCLWKKYILQLYVKSFLLYCLN